VRVPSSPRGARARGFTSARAADRSPGSKDGGSSPSAAAASTCLFHLDDASVLLSHLGMSGRWLFFERPPDEPMDHVHARLGSPTARVSGSRTHAASASSAVRGAAGERDESLARPGPATPLDPPLTARGS
jgi:formamidopyrimidine-DNA glycosylase